MSLWTKVSGNAKNLIYSNEKKYKQNLSSQCRNSILSKLKASKLKIELVSLLENTHRPIAIKLAINSILVKKNMPKDALFINFDNHLNKYSSWVPHFAPQCFQLTQRKNRFYLLIHVNTAKREPICKLKTKIWS